MLRAGNGLDGGSLIIAKRGHVYPYLESMLNAWILLLASLDVEMENSLTEYSLVLKDLEAGTRRWSTGNDVFLF